MAFTACKGSLRHEIRLQQRIGHRAPNDEGFDICAGNQKGCWDSLGWGSRWFEMTTNLSNFFLLFCHDGTSGDAEDWGWGE
jgi:hypothetical protein